MDAVGAGASVLAFVGLALQSVKTVHDFLATIKDGPQKVQRLLTEVGNLQTILERLASMQPSSPNEEDFADLYNLSKKCSEDIVAFELVLRRLALGVVDQGTGRFWRRLKLLVSEKDLDHMREVIRFHVVTLHFHLDIFQVRHMSLSTTQSSKILDRLDQIENTIASLRLLPPPTSETEDVTSTEANPIASQDGNVDSSASALGKVLQECVLRITDMISKKECTVQSSEAEQLMADLETILDSARDKAGCVSPASEGVDSNESDRDEEILKHLKRMKHMICCAPSLSINKGMRENKHFASYLGKSQTDWRIATSSLSVSTPNMAIVHQERKRRVINMDTGSVTLATNTRVKRGERGRRQEDFSAKVFFRLRGHDTVLALSLSQAQVLTGSLLAIPSLAVNNIVPFNSPVFSMAERGHIQALMSLVAKGKASLRDHDPNGWSLLHASQLWAQLSDSRMES